MEVKKSPKADLENKKLLFREIGLVAVLGIVLLAFEWSTKDKPDMMDLTQDAVAVEEEIIPITQEQQELPPEMPKIPVLSDVIVKCRKYGSAWSRETRFVTCRSIPRMTSRREISTR